VTPLGEAITFCGVNHAGMRSWALFGVAKDFSVNPIEADLIPPAWKAVNNFLLSPA
jgi:hypothetical protein